MRTACRIGGRWRKGVTEGEQAEPRYREVAAERGRNAARTEVEEVAVVVVDEDSDGGSYEEFYVEGRDEAGCDDRGKDRTKDGSVIERDCEGDLMGHEGIWEGVVQLGFQGHFPSPGKGDEGVGHADSVCVGTRGWEYVKEYSAATMEKRIWNRSRRNERFNVP